MRIAPTRDVKVPVKTERVHHYVVRGGSSAVAMSPTRSDPYCERGFLCMVHGVTGTAESFEYVGCASAIGAIGGGLVFVPPTVNASISLTRGQHHAEQRWRRNLRGGQRRVCHT